ncbi:MAG: DUF4974 domain-containing protein [Odoribacter sp.]
MDQLKKRFQVSRWIAEHLAGTISDSDQMNLEAWLKESPIHEQEYLELQKDVQSVHPYEKKEVERQWKRFSGRKKRKSFILGRWYQYAAIFLLFLAVAGVIRWQLNENMPVTEAVQTCIHPATGEVLLILSNGETVALNDSVRTLKEESEAEIQVSGEGIIYLEGVGENVKDVYNTLMIPRGGEYHILLSDGTNVWLNSETEFRYPVHFTGDKRQVYLKGEAYFEVSKNAEKPFVVTTSGGIDVKVLGTRFNIASYEEEEEVVTTLVEGSVEVCSLEKTFRIHPDEQLLFNKNSRSFSRHYVDAGIYLAWKDGKFIFDDQPLEQIMKQLQRWYEMDVFYTNEAIRKYRFSGDLKKYDDFGKIVKMIEEVANMQISIKDKCVVIGTK